VSGEPSVGMHAATHERVTVVVPVLNAMRFLPRTVPSLLHAARRTGDVALRYMDNGSTDGTLEFLESIAPGEVLVERLPDASIAALRNAGARDSRADYLSFIDADCTVPPDYFDAAVDVLTSTGAAATGCEARAPDDGHWIERTWHSLHYVGRDRDVHYLNSANFFVRRDAFERIGGFREDLRTGEDAEIGQRLTEAGLRIRESTRVEAVHYGNPASVPEFFRRTVWHGLGMFATIGGPGIDKPSAMMALHLVATLAGVTCVVILPWPLALRLTLALALQLVAPAVTVAHRIRQTGRASLAIPGIYLYWLYYWARLNALWVVIRRRAKDYRK
jgi:cellulose synthase/poly-beta-1,6-N-acetylglucosamine synthase-like glycosyltransferase